MILEILIFTSVASSIAVGGLAGFYYFKKEEIMEKFFPSNKYITIQQGEEDNESIKSL